MAEGGKLYHTVFRKLEGAKPYQTDSRGTVPRPECPKAQNEIIQLRP